MTLLLSVFALESRIDMVDALQDRFTLDDLVCGVDPKEQPTLGEKEISLESTIKVKIGHEFLPCIFGHVEILACMADLRKIQTRHDIPDPIIQKLK